MEKEFVPYKLALRLKALGFDEPCMASRDMGNGNGLIQIPIYQQAFRWFREKYGLLSFIDMDNYSYYRFTIYEGKGISVAPHKTYEEAELACLEKLIEIVEFKSE